MESRNKTTAEHDDADKKIHHISVEKGLRSLQTSIESLDKKIGMEISFGRSFAMAIVRGIGYTLGATIVASAVLFLLAYVLSYTQDIPYIREYLNPDLLEKISSGARNIGK